MALTESPPSSKKLALRSIEAIPNDSAQMRCSAASMCCCLPPPGALSAEPLEEAARVVVSVGMGLSGCAVFDLGSIQCLWRANGYPGSETQSWPIDRIDRAQR